MTALISGSAHPQFTSVKEAFAANFAREDIYREVGSALCVYYRGERVIDLWGGHCDPEHSRPWGPESTINVYSTTKALAALCVAVLVERGELEYSDLASKHWPEFGTAGKDSTTVSHLLSHQSGNPGLREATEHDDLLNWDLICDRLARQEPYWVPGENTAYHGWTCGFLVGEVVNRLTGTTIGAFFRDQIAGPRGAEAYIGLPEEKDAASASLIAPKGGDHAAPDFSALPAFLTAAMTNPVMDPLAPNRREWRAAQLPALGGFASAQGLADIFVVLAEGGSHGGFELLSGKTLDKMTEVVSTRVDAVLGQPMDWAQGVVINRRVGLYGPNPKAFGHSGWGGSFASADRENRIAIGYVCNQMGPDLVGDPRARLLVDEIYKCLG